MTSPLQELQDLGQSVWYDNIRRGLIQSGELERLIQHGVTGLTSNPTIFEKAIAASTDYDDALLPLARAHMGPAQIFETLAMEDIRAAADLLRPTYDRTAGGDGYASFEVNPHLAHDTEGTISEARRLFAALDRPNVLVKVPATPEGIPAVRRLIGEGVNVNVTLIFSLEAYRHVREAYIAGLEDLTGSGGDASTVASVASFFVSRVDTAVDAMLEERLQEGGAELEELSGRAAIANAKMAYQAFKGSFGSERFGSLRAKGARVQRPLWASTGTKNPDYSDVLYVESLVGPNTVNTMPDATLTAFAEHGAAAETIEEDVGNAQRALDSLEDAGISMDQVTALLLRDGVKSFADSFDGLLANIEEKAARLLAQEHRRADVRLGDYLPHVEATAADLRQRDVVGRIWSRNHTVWKPDPEEIADRLGWLTVTETMRDEVPVLRAFAEEVKDAGFQHAVLLGMGGSSLGPEVLRQTFGSASGYPELIVLDSTVPAWVQAVTATIDPVRTLFLVSSKSGSTIEPLSLYKYFRDQVEHATGGDSAGQNFVAITDPATPLETLAGEQGFRRVFLNPPDMGGRYSVLSYFGLVPGALMGIDVETLMDRSDRMRERCASSAGAHENPGAWLGAVIGTLAQRGRDKLTLVTSPSVAGMGPWIEQLIAESTGKEGKGVVPVAGEPLMGPEHYDHDRLFAYLRVEADDNVGTDAAIGRIESSGHPVVQLDLLDAYDLGAEFFRWEFATAVAGAVLGINPFDQPNVQEAKDLTDQVLQGYQATGSLPQAADGGSLDELMAGARPGDYLAIMPYLQQAPDVDGRLAALRRRMTERYRIATTLGYGPRFLHSTGQLHKGGPETGLFLQITGGHETDLPIPGESHTLGVLADAQALGDLSALREKGRRVVRVRFESLARYSTSTSKA